MIDTIVKILTAIAQILRIVDKVEEEVKDPSQTPTPQTEEKELH